MPASGRDAQLTNRFYLFVEARRLGVGLFLCAFEKANITSIMLMNSAELWQRIYLMANKNNLLLKCISRANT